MQTNIPHNKPKCSYLFSFLIFLFFLSLPDFNEVFVEKTFPLSHFLNAFVSLFFGIFLNKITEGRPKKCYNSPKLNFQIALYSSYYMLNCKNLLSMKMTFLKKPTVGLFLLTKFVPLLSSLLFSSLFDILFEYLLPLF